MKKVLIALAVLGVLGLAGVAIFLRSGGPAQAAAIAPADSSIFLNIPNIPLTGFRWTSTALARIAAEPEVRAFLEKPLANAGGQSSTQEAGTHLAAVKPGNIFASIAPGDGAASVLIGFQFWGGKSDYEKAVARLREALQAALEGPTTKNHSNIEIVSTKHGSTEVHSAAVGRWGLLSNDLAGLESAIDRALGNKPEGGLDSNERFKKTIAALPGSPDLVAFVQPAGAVGTLSSSPIPAAAQAAARMNSLGTAEAIGAALKLDGELQRDAIFILKPGTKKPASNPPPGSIQFTTPSTVVFARDFSTGFDDIASRLRGLAEAYPALPAELLVLTEALSGACGPEAALIADWPEGALAPSPLLAIETPDADRAREALSVLATLLPGSVLEESGGLQTLSLPTQFTPVSIAQGRGYLLAAIDPARLVAAANADPGKSTLESSPSFKSALPAFRHANSAFCYIDTAAAFERLHATFVPVLRFTAAMVPSIGENVDVSKIPSAATISKHLPPIVLSRSDTAGGVLVESSGPISMGQLVILGAAGFTAANPGILKSLLEP